MFSSYIKYGTRLPNTPLYEKDDISLTIRIGKLVICFAKVDMENIVHDMLSELKTTDGVQGVIDKKEREIVENRKLIENLKQIIKHREVDIQKLKEEATTINSENEDLEEEVDRYIEDLKVLEQENQSLKLELTHIKMYYVDKCNTF